MKSFKERTGRSTTDAFITLTDEERARYLKIHTDESESPTIVRATVYGLAIALSEEDESNPQFMETINDYLINSMEFAISVLPGYVSHGEDGLIWRSKPTISFDGSCKDGNRRIKARCRVYGYTSKHKPSLSTIGLFSPELTLFPDGAEKLMELVGYKVDRSNIDYVTNRTISTLGCIGLLKGLRRFAAIKKYRNIYADYHQEVERSYYLTEFKDKMLTDEQWGKLDEFISKLSD